MISIKREHIVILVAAALVVGFVAGRATIPKAPTDRGLPPFSMAPLPVPRQVAPAPPSPTPPKAEAAAPQSGPAEPGPRPTNPTPPAAGMLTTPPAPTTAGPPRTAPTPEAMTATPPSIPQEVWKVRISGQEATKGPADATVTVVLMTSFGCRECLDFQPAIAQMLEEYQDQVRLIFKHKVFDAEHPDALLAALAAAAAQEQGKFWEYADKLWEAKFALSRDKLEALAGELGLNLPRFKKALDSEKTRAQVLSDSLVAYEVGAHSFPNLMANGVRLPKPKTWPTLKALIDGELTKAKAKIASGMSAKLLYQEIIKEGKEFPQIGPSEGAIDTAGAAALGKAGGKIQVVVFEDFECPFCAKASPNLKAFAARYPNDVQLVFKHNPLTSIHQNAQLASEAAAEAQAQGKFWEYHDQLFGHQDALSRADLDRYAQAVGLDLAKFKAALDQGTHRAQLDNDVREAQRLNVTGTPVVFMNGRRYQGPRGFQPLGMEAVALQNLGL
jgi:protein-disulfide isomerase